MEIINPSEIKIASNRIKDFVHRTPILSSKILNDFLGHQIFFKVEALQKIGAFKIRGAFNKLLKLRENNYLPKEVVAFSSGNHAGAVAYAGKILGIKTTIILPEFTSKIKQQATEFYGANVINTPTRKKAEELTAKIANEGALFIHPFDDDDIICGQGTSCYEALQDLSDENIDAIFATCGGGGWLSGSFLAKELLSKKTKIYGVEPLLANDACKSYRQKEIFRFNDSPPTIADGARAPAVSKRTFHYLQQLDGFFEASEEQIIYWTQWLMHLLKITIEPTSALTMSGAVSYLMTQNKPCKILILLSGGNVDPSTYKTIWENNFLKEIPTLNKNII